MPIQVMVVDDEDGVRTLVGLMLERFGFQVIKASDGEAAMAMLENMTPAIILLDIMMPGINGIDLCRQIRANPQTADTPVLFLSALADAKTIERGEQAGGNGHLRKPVMTGELVDKVRQLLKANDQLRTDSGTGEALFSNNVAKLITTVVRNFA